MFGVSCRDTFDSFWHMLRHSFWHFFWHVLHSVWHCLHTSWPSARHSFWHIFRHYFWHSLQISWHSVRHSFWHIFRHYLGHLFWYPFASVGVGGLLFHIKDYHLWKFFLFSEPLNSAFREQNSMYQYQVSCYRLFLRESQDFRSQKKANNFRKSQLFNIVFSFTIIVIHWSWNVGINLVKVREGFRFLP